MKAQGKNAQKTFNKNFILTFAAITSLLYVSILATFHQTSIVYAENENVKVYGFIFEFGTNKPLQGAKINLAQTLLAETNASGYFEGYVKSFSEYTFTVYCDDPATPGLDYVPAYKGVFVGGTPQYLSFFLLPGASINAIEDPFFLLDEVFFSYEVKDEKGLLESSGSISQSSEWRVLASKQRIIPVPPPASKTKPLFGRNGSINLHVISS
jgi:hypothetical protein